MSHLANMLVILKSRDAEPSYKERTRQQVIHLAFAGDEDAIRIVGPQVGFGPPQGKKHCPCTNCHYQHMLDGVRAETYK